MLSDTNDEGLQRRTRASRLHRMAHLSWLGQTVASLAWIASVFSYGISQAGDWLQLVAASSWFLANVATIVAPQSPEGAD